MARLLTWVPSTVLACEINAQEGEVLYTVTRHMDFGLTQSKNVAYAGDLKLGTFEPDGPGFLAAKLACQTHADSLEALPATIPASATSPCQLCRLDNDDKPQPKLGPGWDHRLLSDSRTPEERAAAEAKERKRRRGGNRNWVLQRKEKGGAC